MGAHAEGGAKHMTVGEIVKALQHVDPNRRVVISNVRNSPFAVLPIKEVEIINVLYPEGPVHIVAKQQ